MRLGGLQPMFAGQVEGLPPMPPDGLPVDDMGTGFDFKVVLP